MNVFNPTTGECTCGYMNNKIGGDKCESCGTKTSMLEALGRPVFQPNYTLKEPDRIRLSKERDERVLNSREDSIVSEFTESSTVTMDEFLRALSPKERPEFRSVYMQLAMIFSLRSTCSRRKVGTVIVSEDYRRVLSVGYNGNASGLPNCCDEPEKSGGCGCLHAEENAVISCSEPSITPKVVFTTTYPCKMCAKRLVQLGGVTKVYYTEDYHDSEAEKVFEVVGIETERIIFKREIYENTF
jgi:dCMP deaminase